MKLEDHSKQYQEPDTVEELRYQLNTLQEAVRGLISWDKTIVSIIVSKEYRDWVRKVTDLLSLKED